ncbi:hypothetical protein Ptr902_04864 [Pyrenophora tritici-repentis]|nr:hypothetical protein Ptr902_04864 [Pyrenophora tritici-repentis]
MSSLEDDEPNYLEGFDRVLPKVHLKKMPYTIATSSGITTENAVAPQVLLYTSVKRHSTKAAHTLKVDRDIKKKKGILEKRHFPTAINSPLVSEADVIRETDKHLLDPIFEVLNIMYPKSWQQLWEHYGKESVRLDLVFLTIDEDDKGAQTKIAVIEFKRRGLIKYDDFHKALLSEHASEKEILDTKIQAVNNGGTLLEGNGATFSKQASGYAMKAKCKHVGLFNWEHLVLFEFDKLNIDDAPKKFSRNMFAAGDTAKISWVYEDADCSENGHLEHHQDYTYRRVLLGWLLHAFDDALKPGKDA